MKRLITLLLAVVMLVTVCVGCATKVLQCDHCGKDVTVKESSNMENEWIVYCEECNEELFGDDPLLSGK